jgi:hypothetical protein
MKNRQWQVRKNNFLENRLVELNASTLQLHDGEILLQVEKFAYTSNNITYALAGDTMGYWQFFLPTKQDRTDWGIIPVWGFATVVQSTVAEIAIGERLFGYLPPATYCKLKPDRMATERFIDSTIHRASLPVGYRLYRRVTQEKGYNAAFDKERMLLFPLHLTSFCLWDALREATWYAAEQIIVLSASSKTSIGLGYALAADDDAPYTIGVTAERNVAAVQQLQIYDDVVTYDTVTDVDAHRSTVIVDLSGNANVLATLQTHLGKQLTMSKRVGFTHWSDTQQQKEGWHTENSQLFFAPAHIQKRIQEWGAVAFHEKTTSFLLTTAAKTKKWLTFSMIDGLNGLAAIHDEVCHGRISPQEGLIVQL